MICEHVGGVRADSLKSFDMIMSSREYSPASMPDSDQPPTPSDTPAWRDRRWTLRNFQAKL